MKRGDRLWKRYDNKKTPLTEEEIDSIIEGEYFDAYPKTKEYIRNGLRTVGPRFKFRSHQMIKEDLIDLYKLTRESNSLPVFDYDFSLVPEIIGGEKIKFELICKILSAGKRLVNSLQTTPN